MKHKKFLTAHDLRKIKELAHASFMDAGPDLRESESNYNTRLHIEAFFDLMAYKENRVLIVNKEGSVLFDSREEE